MNNIMRFPFSFLFKKIYLAVHIIVVRNPYRYMQVVQSVMSNLAESEDNKSPRYIGHLKIKV